MAKHTEIMMGCDRRHGQGAVLLSVFGLTVGLGAAALAANEESPRAVAAPARPATVTVTAKDIIRSEAQYSPGLRNYRRNYRMVSMLREKADQKKRMLTMASEIQRLLPAQSDKELALWLELQQNAYTTGGKTKLAVAVLEKRYTLLSGKAIKLGKTARLSKAAKMGKPVDLDKLAEQALKEATLATAFKHYEIAEALHKRAISVAKSQAMRVQAVMALGRLISRTEGMEAAVEYYMSLAKGQVDSLGIGKVKLEPEMAREAHYRAAVEYYRHDQLERALKVLDDIEAAYPDEPEAEKARHTRKGWQKTPDEE